MCSMSAARARMDRVADSICRSRMRLLRFSMPILPMGCNTPVFAGIAAGRSRHDSHACVVARGLFDKRGVLPARLVHPPQGLVLLLYRGNFPFEDSNPGQRLICTVGPRTGLREETNCESSRCQNSKFDPGNRAGGNDEVSQRGAGFSATRGQLRAQGTGITPGWIAPRGHSGIGSSANAS